LTCGGSEPEGGLMITRRRTVHECMRRTMTACIVRKRRSHLQVIGRPPLIRGVLYVQAAQDTRRVRLSKSIVDGKRSGLQALPDSSGATTHANRFSPLASLRTSVAPKPARRGTADRFLKQQLNTMEEL
jgi:hypothetical protein